MKAACITSRSDLGQISKIIEIKELPIPEPGKNEVRIKVKASTINIDDIHIAEGTMFGGLPVSPNPSQNKPYVPGTDVAGIIDAVGSNIKSFKVGDKVYGMCNAMSGRGPWAEFCITGKKNISLKPDLWDFQEAAACAIAGAVAISMINAVKDFKNKKCLIIGASGGIGSLCVQALKYMNARVWAVCSQKNAELVQQLGAERVIDYKKASFAEQLQNSNEQVDIAFDLVGGKETERDAFKILSSNGTFVTVVGPTKYIGETNIGILPVFLSFIYIGWRMLLTSVQKGPKYIFTGPTTPDFGKINTYLVGPGCKPVIDTVSPLTKEDVSAAIIRVRSHRVVGKVIINVS